MLWFVIGLVPLVALVCLSAGVSVEDHAQTCEELASLIKGLSEERETPFSGRVLKFYDIETLEPAEGEALICSARAARSRGGEVLVEFYRTEADEDGDRFIGMRIAGRP